MARRRSFGLRPSSAGPLDSSSPNVRRVVAGKDRQVAVALCPDEIDLGVEVYLHKFRRKLDPGAAMASHYSSLIDFRDRKDPAHILEKNVEVKMNQPAEFYDPATGRSYRLFQTSFQGPLSAESLGSSWTGPGDPPPRLFLSEFTLNGDPGRGLKYAACLAVFCGVFVRYFLKSQLPKDSSGGGNGQGSGGGEGGGRGPCGGGDGRRRRGASRRAGPAGLERLAAIACPRRRPDHAPGHLRPLDRQEGLRKRAAGFPSRRRRRRVALRLAGRAATVGNDGVSPGGRPGVACRVVGVAPARRARPAASLCLAAGGGRRREAAAAIGGNQQSPTAG